MNIDNFKKMSKLITEDKDIAYRQGYCNICAHSLHNVKGLIGKCQHCYNFSLWKWRYEANILALIWKRKIDIEALTENA